MSLVGTVVAFAAVKSDGSVVTWGRTAYGGDVTISSGVSIIYPNLYALVAAGPLNHTYGPEVTGTGSISFTKNKCSSCPAGTTNVAGDPIGADTYCDLDTSCGHNEFVNTNHQCEACSAGTYNDVGDVTVGTCDDAEKCLADYYVKLSYDSDSTKKYGTTACTSTSDCETKCDADSTCLGYTIDALTFSAENEVTSTLDGSIYGIDSGDIDGDGDIDIVGAGKNKIVWYENNGTQSFEAHDITTSVNNNRYGLKVVDLDGDGDLDVVNSDYSGDTLAWYENTDGQGTFSAQNHCQWCMGSGCN